MKLNSKIYNLERDGVTQGTLEMFQTCREKARLFLEGWSTKADSGALVYGSIGHAVLEHAYEAIRTSKRPQIPSAIDVKKITQAIEKQWHLEHPRAGKNLLDMVEFSLALAEATLPVYFEYWEKDIKTVKWEKVENSFSLPVKIKDGRTIPVRGKMDGVFRNPQLRLFETKFKSLINEEDIVDTLPIDKQCNLYLTVLYRTLNELPAGVLYNVVRRTSLRQKKTESLPVFVKRVVADIRKRPEFYFIRFNISVDKKEILDFEQEMKAMIEDFVAWHDGKVGHYKCSHSCITKYGRCPYLGVCSSQNYGMLEKRKKVFRELDDY